MAKSLRKKIGDFVNTKHGSAVAAITTYGAVFAASAGVLTMHQVGKGKAIHDAVRAEVNSRPVASQMGTTAFADLLPAKKRNAIENQVNFDLHQRLSPLSKDDRSGVAAAFKQVETEKKQALSEDSLQWKENLFAYEMTKKYRKSYEAHEPIAQKAFLEAIAQKAAAVKEEKIRNEKTGTSTSIQMQGDTVIVKGLFKQRIAR